MCQSLMKLAAQLTSTLNPRSRPGQIFWKGWPGLTLLRGSKWSISSKNSGRLVTARLKRRRRRLLLTTTLWVWIWRVRKRWRNAEKAGNRLTFCPRLAVAATLLSFQTPMISIKPHQTTKLSTSINPLKTMSSLSFRTNKTRSFIWQGIFWHRRQENTLWSSCPIFRSMTQAWTKRCYAGLKG